MGPWGDGAWSGGWHVGGLFMMFMMAAFWLVAIAGAIILFRWLARNNQNQKPTSSNAALEHLKLRYVKGEISKEEFEQMKKDIQ